MSASDAQMSNDQPTVLHHESSTASEPRTLPTEFAGAPAEQPPQIEGYEVVRVLGIGGMGAVYEVVNRLGRRFALKVIRPDRTDPEMLLRFRQEAGTLLDLDHPHIARIFEYNEIAGSPYFTMRLLTGGTLQAALPRYRTDVRQAVELLATIAEAVGYLHRRGLLHRDLKPNNILFDDEGRPFVSDFGLVKQLTLSDSELAPGNSFEDTADSLTGAGRLLGTVPYMAPEQLRGEQERIGPATDVWALGVISYEVLTGHRPFAERDVTRVKAQIAAANPAPPSVLRQDLEGELEAIVLKCLAEKPEERYRTGDELAAALRHWAAQRANPPAQKQRRRAGWLKVGAAFLGLAALLTAVFFLFKPSREPLKHIEEKLRRGEAVELLGATGPPPFHEVVCSTPGTINHFVEPDGVFTIETRGSLVLLELVPARLCPPQGYRLTAQVRWNEGTPLAGRSGLYVCRTAQPLKGVVNQFFAAFGFVDEIGVDVPDMKPPAGQRLGNRAFTLDRWEDVPGQPKYYTPYYFSTLHVFFANQPPGRGQSAQWRDLELEVRPEGIACKWQGQLAGELSAAKFGKPQNLTFGTNEPPIVLPLGGIGLQVFDASVSFRSVTIVPFPLP